MKGLKLQRAVVIVTAIKESERGGVEMHSTKRSQSIWSKSDKADGRTHLTGMRTKGTGQQAAAVPTSRQLL